MSSKNYSIRIGIGAVIAVVVSWMTNYSILWCIIHGFCGWFYLLYRIGGCGGVQ